MRRILAAACIVFLMPAQTLAENPSLTRREGFLLLWGSIHRAVGLSHEESFQDVREGDEGYGEIDYAKDRGVLDDEGGRFRPDDPLTWNDALLWLMRTRNVADLDEMQGEHLSVLLRRYPVFPEERTAATVESADALISVMTALDSILATEAHEVSLYGEDFHGQGTAFGETFDMNALTAAHRTFPPNTLVKVTNIENGQSVTVRINDRGPYVEGRDMDLSLAAFTRIADRRKGVIEATFERLGDATLVNTCTGRPLVYRRRITKNVRFHRGVPSLLSLGGTLTLGANKYFVVRSVQYPDGMKQRVQDWVSPAENFSFTPSMAGLYAFEIATTEGRIRRFEMEVVDCPGVGRN